MGHDEDEDRQAVKPVGGGWPSVLPWSMRNTCTCCLLRRLFARNTFATRLGPEDRKVGNAAAVTGV